MANSKTGAINAEIRKANENVQDLRQRKSIACNHTRDEGVQLQMLAESDEAMKRGVFNINQYPPNSVICSGQNGCGAIFSMDGYKPDEVYGLQFQFYSMIQQIKSLTVLNPDQAAELNDIEVFYYKSFTDFCRFYIKMAEKMMSKDNKNRNNGGSTKGNIGIPSTYRNMN